jgi:hypothetical protein
MSFLTVTTRSQAQLHSFRKVGLSSQVRCYAAQGKGVSMKQQQSKCFGFYSLFIRNRLDSLRPGVQGEQKPKVDQETEMYGSYAE